VRRSAVQNSRNPPLQFTKGITGSGPRSRWRSRGAVPTNDEEGQQTRGYDGMDSSRRTSNEHSKHSNGCGR
jgi:hypothetical protein